LHAGLIREAAKVRFGVQAGERTPAPQVTGAARGTMIERPRLADCPAAGVEQIAIDTLRDRMRRLR